MLSFIRFILARMDQGQNQICCGVVHNFKCCVNSHCLYIVINATFILKLFYVSGPITEIDFTACHRTQSLYNLCSPASSSPDQFLYRRRVCTAAAAAVWRRVMDVRPCVTASIARIACPRLDEAAAAAVGTSASLSVLRRHVHTAATHPVTHYLGYEPLYH